MKSDNFMIFFSGFIVGCIIFLIIMLILYSNRKGVFQYCSTEGLTCSISDYYNNPRDAMNQGYEFDDILYIKNDQLFYNRVKKESKKCNPGPNKEIKIKFPEYCIFENTNKNRTIWKDVGFMRNTYQNPDFDFVIKTDGDCKPQNENFTKSEILLLWNS
jgi:hypothetical protein